MRKLTTRQLPQILVSLTLGLSAGGAGAQTTRLSPDIHRVLVIPIVLPDRAPLSIDRAQIAQALFTAGDSVNAQYRALSYGSIAFIGSKDDVIDPVTLKESSEFCNTGLKQLADEAMTEVQRRGIAQAAYQHFVFVIPKDTPCSWTGLGGIGGDRVWLKATTAKAFAHELGHNLGMDHAVRWGTSSEAEGSDLMGSGNAQLNAPHIIQMGWLRDYPGKVIEVTAAGEFTLEALETDPRQSTLPKVAIVRPAAGANTYSLSYRAAGSANPLSGEFTRGLNIHIFDHRRRTGGLTYFVTSLSDGMSYSDGPLIVRQLAHLEGERVTFSISFSGTGRAIPAGPPPAPPGTVQSLASGKCLDLPRGQRGDGTSPVQYDCHGGANQLWKIVAVRDSGYQIVSRLSGKCIGADSTSDKPASRVAQAECGTSSDQLWQLNGVGNVYAIQNVASRLCLDVPGASTANGIELTTWSCNGGNNQSWRFLTDENKQ
jgi:hypothetical protein